MTMIRPEAVLVFDNPDCDGRIDLHGWGKEWLFRAQRQEGNLRPGPGAWAPDWIHSGTEIVPGLDVLSLKGEAPVADMSLDDVDIVHGTGKWGIERADWQGAVNWLLYSDGSTTGYGIVRSKAAVSCNLVFRAVSCAPRADLAGDPLTEFELLGDGTAARGYSLYLPVHTRTQRWPELYNGQPGAWVKVDEFRRSDAGGDLDAQGARPSLVWFEFLEGQIIIRLGGCSEPWIYTPPAGHEPVSGKWRAGFEGRMGLVNVAEIAYPLDAECTAADFGYSPLDCDPDPNWKASASAGADVDLTWSEGISNHHQKPTIYLSTADVHVRPVVYLVHEYHEATLQTRPMETPINTATRAAALKIAGQDASELIGLRWRRRKYRDWQLGAIVRDPHAYWGGILKPNMKVAAATGWDNTRHDLMTAYLDGEPIPTRPKEEAGQVTHWELTGRDYIMGRLTKKHLLENVSPEGWDLAEWVSYQLVRAGCGLDIDFPSGTIVPHGLVKAIAWETRPSDDLLPALDKILIACGWCPLGIDETNVIWAGPETPPTTPDYVLDGSQATGDNIIHHLRVEPDHMDEARNAVAAVTRDSVIRLYANDGWCTPTDPAFVGDDEWLAEDLGDVTDAEAGVWLTRELARRLARRKQLIWERKAIIDVLAPGAVVEVTVDGYGVPAETKFIVVEDEGELDPIAMTGWQTCMCEML